MKLFAKVARESLEHAMPKIPLVLLQVIVEYYLPQISIACSAGGANVRRILFPHNEFRTILLVAEYHWLNWDICWDWIQNDKLRTAHRSYVRRPISDLCEHIIPAPLDDGYLQSEAGATSIQISSNQFARLRFAFAGFPTAGEQVFGQIFLDINGKES
jgi:hypothetical protein